MFIKIKPTVVNGCYGLVLIVRWFAGFRLVDKVLGKDALLDEEGLRKLTLRTGFYLLGPALKNAVVWRTLPTDS